ncbi:hypothetical protein C8J57DRAFT_1306741, partial [Mycena rebaudengoi]
MSPTPDAQLDTLARTEGTLIGRDVFELDSRASKAKALSLFRYANKGKQRNGHSTALMPSDIPRGPSLFVAASILAVLSILGFLSWRLLRRHRRRRHALMLQLNPPRTLGGPPRTSFTPPPRNEIHAAVLYTDRDAEEQLMEYPPIGTATWPLPLTPLSSTSMEPGPASSPAARQAYLAAEVRAAQAQLERIGGGQKAAREAAELKRRIRELEERHKSAWALGL